VIALVLVILTSSALAEASPLNNESQDVPTEVVAEVKTDRPQVKAPKVREKRKVEAEKPKPVVTQLTGCEHYKELISQYDWNVSVALAVVQAESGCNPNAIGDNYPIGGLLAPSCGLFQVRTLAGRPSCEQLQNPATNVEWAYKLYRESNWQPWSVCKNGKVSCY